MGPCFAPLALLYWTCGKEWRSGSDFQCIKMKECVEMKMKECLELKMKMRPYLEIVADHFHRADNERICNSSSCTTIPKL